MGGGPGAPFATAELAPMRKPQRPTCSLSPATFRRPLELARVVPSQRAVAAGVGVDLRAVKADRSQFQHPHLAREQPRTNSRFWRIPAMSLDPRKGVSEVSPVRPRSARGKPLRLALRWPRRSPRHFPEPRRDDVYDACLVLNDRSRHTVHRFMSCPLRSVSERPRLEVRQRGRTQRPRPCDAGNPLARLLRSFSLVRTNGSANGAALRRRERSCAPWARGRQQEAATRSSSRIDPPMR